MHTQLRFLALFVTLFTVALEAWAGFGVGPTSSAKWPGGVIPYRFSSTIATSTRDVVVSAMATWENASQGTLRFVPRTNEADYVLVTYADDCRNRSSSIGRSGGEQTLFLGAPARCGEVPSGLALHELGHAIGLIHEHQRDDRDRYVDVRWENIFLPAGEEAAAKAQFAIVREHDPSKAPVDPTKYGAYDLKDGAQSIMHYSSWQNNVDFGIGKGDHPVLVFKSGATIPYPRTLSTGDAETVRAIYAAKPVPTSTPTPFPREASLATRVNGVISAYVSATPAKCKAPGILVGVTLDGKHTFFPFGTTEVGTTRTPSSRDLWEIGSNTKVFTSLPLALYAKESGNAEAFLKKRVGEIFPGIKANITLEQLASHTSGLPREIPPSLLDPLSDSLDEFLRIVSGAPIQSPPGEKYGYSNPGYSLLGNALAALKGKDYRAEIESRILAPLGLAQTRFDPSGYRVKGYRFEAGQLTLIPSLRIGLVNAPTGGLHSSGEDLLRYLDAFLSPPTTPAGAALAFVKPVRKSYDCPIPGEMCAIGLGIERFGTMFYKTGQTQGMQSIVAFEEGRAGIFLVANQHDIPGLVPLARRLLNEVYAARSYEQEVKRARIAALQQNLRQVQLQWANAHGALMATNAEINALHAQWNHYYGIYQRNVSLFNFYYAVAYVNGLYGQWNWYVYHLTLAYNYLGDAYFVSDRVLRPLSQRIAQLEQQARNFSATMTSLQQQSTAISAEIARVTAE